jgi:uncharacterized RDD family membrane protein YckC
MTGHVDPIPKEARAFQGRRAGLVTRTAAACIDIGVVVSVLIVAYFGFVLVLFIVRPSRSGMPVPPVWLDTVVPSIVMTLYLAVSWHSGGRTLGCHVMGLRVIDRRGREPNVVTALLRAAFSLVFPLGLVWVGLSRQNRSIQDIVFRTSVIYDWVAGPRVRAVAPAVVDESLEVRGHTPPRTSTPIKPDSTKASSEARQRK